MADRIERLTGGSGADAQRRPPAREAPPWSARRRRPTEPELRVTTDEALGRLRAAARDAGQDVQFTLEAVDDLNMVVARLSDGTIVRRIPLGEALRLAASLCGGTGGLFQGSL